MRKDHHIHPTVMQTPERFAEYVSVALEKGIGELCITDHMPLSLSHAKDRLLKGSVREYCARVRCLAAEYRGRIAIKCGIEIDFHPSVMGEIEEVLSEGDFDLVLGSTHLHIFEKGRMDRYTHNDFAALSLENSIKAAQSGLFDVLAHPDMYRFPFLYPERFPLRPDGYAPNAHEGLIKELLHTVKKQGIRLEINPHLAEPSGDTNLVYPEPTVLKWALEMGVQFSYGSDAHKPQSVGAMLDELEAHPLYGCALRDFEK